MFWDSVFAGLRVFTYWETYVAGIEYLAIFINRLIIIGNFMEKIKSQVDWEAALVCFFACTPSSNNGGIVTHYMSWLGIFLIALMVGQRLPMQRTA